jgi:hypothetical protein
MFVELIGVDQREGELDIALDMSSRKHKAVEGGKLDLDPIFLEPSN